MTVTARLDLPPSVLNRLSAAVPEALDTDSSTRRYYRLRHAAGSAIFMESPPDGSPRSVPGHGVHDFIRIGEWLRTVGLHAPEIYEYDETQGFLLIEDLGEISFKQALMQGMPDRDIYGLAVDVLAHLRKTPCALSLPSYYESHVHTGRRRIVDWFMPALRLQKNSDHLADEYLAVWGGIEKSLPPCPQGFLHIDYHVENLMWIPGKEGLQSCGILDFQGAMRGPLPYDLANLLEDARIDVSLDLRRAMIDRYCRAMDRVEKELFEAWYRILATQFHCRVAGQFIRLAVRDGKTKYLAHVPRVIRYIREGLQDPLLRPLQDWFAAQGLTLESVPDVSNIKSFIREDAF